MSQHPQPPRPPRRYALDIETTGLDCRTDRITSVGIYGSGVAFVLEDPNEDRLLESLWLYVTKLPAGEIVTWNGAVFDGPFLSHRAVVCRLPSEWFPLVADPDIAPKYEPQPGFRPVGYHLAMQAGGWRRHTHRDLAYELREWATAHHVKWGLKPVARAAGIEGVIEVDREHMDLLTVPERMAYNLSDVVATYELAAMADRGMAEVPDAD